MEIMTIGLKVPFDKKGLVLRKLANLVEGRIRKAKLLPPDKFGYNEIIINLETKNPRKVIMEISKVGKVEFLSH
ncbi:hypothetical protein [Thermococcus chitonophagus]|uniref:Uncharacterized protein n=1 Tax=Thermococcus chitonophagus TaxID=54262 RepID=A0A160VUG1_9EURY|nr:hypothetical protein [Thermococcus chitonophagus]CUX78246.1 hypothetical protein CHITON_1467 [Thermococcus chitonophagus]